MIVMIEVMIVIIEVMIVILIIQNKYLYRSSRLLFIEYK